MSVTMQFGNVGEKNDKLGGMELIDSGYLSGENRSPITIDLSGRQMYVLFTREIYFSNGALRGFRAVLIARTDAETEVQRGNLYASSNSGVTLSYSGETVTIRPSVTSCDVYYALYSVM